ncbi:MAG: JAB domain-containing protein [Kiritimatiellia bacterium]
MSDPVSPSEWPLDSAGADDDAGAAAVRWVRERLLRKKPLPARENAEDAEPSPLVALLQSANLPEQCQKELVDGAARRLGVLIARNGNLRSRWSKRNRQGLPRERLETEGPEALQDNELLAVLLETGVKGMTVLETANALYEAYDHSLGKMFRELTDCKNLENGCIRRIGRIGIGPARTAVLRSIFEIAGRLNAEIATPGRKLQTPDRIAAFLSERVWKCPAAPKTDTPEDGCEIWSFALNKKMQTHSATFFSQWIPDPGAPDAEGIACRILRDAVRQDGCYLALGVVRRGTDWREPPEWVVRLSRLLVGAGLFLQIPLLDTILIQAPESEPMGAATPPYCSLRRERRVNYTPAVVPAVPPLGAHLFSGILPEPEKGSEKESRRHETSPEKPDLRERHARGERMENWALIALILRTGCKGRPVEAVSKDIMRETGNSFVALRDRLYAGDSFMGIGKTRTLSFLAAFEVARRVQKEAQNGVAAEDEHSFERLDMRNPVQIVRLLSDRIMLRPTEAFFAVPLRKGKYGYGLCSKTRKTFEIFAGTADSSMVHLRDVFQEAIRQKADGLVVAHNHPTGDPAPSAQDETVTRRMVAAGDLLGIPVLDHIVIGGYPDADGRTLPYYSFSEHGVIAAPI